MNLNIEKCFYDLAYIVSELDSLFALSITPADLHGFAGFLCAAPCSADKYEKGEIVE